MAGDTLATLGEKVTDLFVNAFASGDPDVSLVFLPFALPTPDDIVQGGVVNPTRLASFLLPNFDAPYLMSPSQYTVHGKDLYYGSASQIYTLAATSASSTAAVGSDAWKRVNAQIAMAQSLLSPPGVSPEMACIPDDWMLPDTSYWSTFDSTSHKASPTRPRPPRQRLPVPRLPPPQSRLPIPRPPPPRRLPRAEEQPHRRAPSARCCGRSSQRPPKLPRPRV